MVLGFNLFFVFSFTVFLMLWHMVLPYTVGMGGIILGAYLGWRYKKGKLSIQDVIFALGFIFNLWYVVSLDINVRQYDYFNFFMQAFYFVENDFFIDGPLGYLKSAYYQPPFFVGIAGIITKIGMLFGMTREEGFDEARFISLFAVSGVYVIYWRFLNLFKFDKKVMLWVYAGFVFLSFHTILSGLNNNDALVYFFMVMILYKGYLWYCDASLENAFKVSLFVMFAGMTKFSGLMMMAYLGMLGLALLIERKNKFDAKLWVEFLVIGLGGIIGFSWGIFLLTHGVGLVPPPQSADYQLMSEYSIWQRLIDFSNINILFADVRNGVIEPNVWLSLIKTSIFGEWVWENVVFSYILYVINILFAVFFVYSFGGVFKYKIGNDFGLNLAVIVSVVAVLISWAMFWFKFPYFCSTEFRYVAILMPFGFLWLANFLTQKKLPKWGNVTLAVLSVLFVFAKVIVYLSTI